MNTTAKETVCEECEKYKEIRVGSVHYVDALNCRMKPSDRAFSEKIPANELNEVVDRLEVLADPIAETLPEYERINEFVSLVGKLRPALNQHSARIVERLEAEKKKHTNDPEAKHYNDEIYCCLDCYDEGLHDKGIDQAIDIINNKNERL